MCQFTEEYHISSEKLLITNGLNFINRLEDPCQLLVGRGWHQVDSLVNKRAHQKLESGSQHRRWVLLVAHCCVANPCKASMFASLHHGFFPAGCSSLLFISQSCLRLERAGSTAHMEKCRPAEGSKVAVTCTTKGIGLLSCHLCSRRACCSLLA